MALRAVKPVETGAVSVTVQPINMAEIRLKIRGLSPLVMNAFSEKATRQMMEQMSTPQAKKKAKSERKPRDYEAEHLGAHHFATEGWVGIPCNGFRACAIESCRLAGVMMTRAKQALFMVADGWDRVDGQGLVKLDDMGEPPEKTIMHVRLESGVVSLACRPMWRKWQATITVRYDADWISVENVINLFNRGGQQVGLCEGRPGSPNSYGMGWGTFAIVGAVNPEPIPAPDPSKLINMLEDGNGE